MKAELTVVVPVKDRAGVVEATLRSLAAQGVQWPVVLVDNGSSDATGDVLRRWAREQQLVRAAAAEAQAVEAGAVTVVEEPTPGAAAARNRGLREVLTPWVLFFDSDDIMLAGHLQRVAEGIAHHPDAAIVGWDVAVKKLDGSRERREFAASDLMFRNMFNAIFATQRYAVRVELLRTAGAWDESALGWDDYELGFRLAALRPRVVKLAGAPTVLVVEQERSITGSDYASGAAKWEHALDLCEATLRRHGLRRELRWLELRRMVLAGLYAREAAAGNAPQAGCEARRLRGEVLARAATPWRRALLRAACAWTCRGGRGAHWLLRPLI